ncbi:MAG TPA: type IV pilus assembly protein PilM, partial [Planctomycetota bacterium]|nr:type IV pilus assembly protein PilM [Planctomycetota bacterium]
VVGLDVGFYSVKVVALQPSGNRLTLQGYAQARIGSQEPVEVIRKVIDQLGLRPKRMVTSVSGRSVIVRQVETPRLPSDELKAHIAYEADKYIPFGSEEVIIDCQTLPDRDEAKATNMQVLLVAVRRGFVEDHITQLKAAGLAPEVIDVDVFALSNAYELLGPGPGAAGEKAATALIDIGASKSNIAIVQGTRLLFTREVYLAGNEITDAIVRTFNEPAEDVERIKSAPGEALEALMDAALPAFEDLANEIRLSFDYVEGQFEVQVADLVLTGGSSQLPGIAEILGNILGRPVHVFDPLAGLDLVPSKYDINGLDANGPSLTVALGLAAHVLQFSQTGLGGANSHNWQPRQVRDGTIVPKAPAATAPQVPTPAPEPMNRATASVTRPPPPAPLPMQAAPQPTPAPLPLAPPPAPIFTPPPAVPVGKNILDLDMPMEAAEDSPSTDAILSDPTRSALLVVLDEDQEMPPSERHERGTSKSNRPSQVLKVESFEEDDTNEKSGGLPELPKL